MNPISIFIVEDELLISANLKSQLQSFGYEVLGSSTKGEQCLQDIERLSKEGKEPEIVLMDIHLRGEMDGIETARRLVEKFNCAIIFLTGQSSKEIYEHSFKIKPFGYLLKPIDMEQTKMTIEIAAYQRNLEIENLVYQKQLEVLLEERKRENDEIMALYRNISDNSMIGIGIVQEGKITYANRYLAEIWGFTLDDLVGKDVMELNKMVHPDERERIFERMIKRIKGEDVPNSGRFRLIRRDGSTCYVEYSALLIHYKGRPAIQQIFYDITHYTGMLQTK